MGCASSKTSGTQAMDVKVPWKKAYYYKPGYMLPAIMNQNTIDTQFKNFEIKDDDIFLITYPKSGTAWTNEMLKAIIHADDLEYLETVEFYKKLATLEFGPAEHPDLVAEGVQCPKSFIDDFINDAPSPRVISTHMMPEYMPTQYFEKKPKTVFVGRDPKDVIVSLHAWHNSTHFMGPCTWEVVIEEYCKGLTEYGPVWDYFKAWSKYMNESWVLWLKFEDIKANPKESIKKMADFIGRPLTEEKADAVTHATSFQVMKERNERAMNTEFFFSQNKGEGKAEEEKKEESEKAEEEETKERTQWQRKGQVGGWKTRFTVAQNDAFDKVYKEKMKGFEHVMYQY